MALFWKAIIGVLDLAVLSIGEVRAQESQDTNNSTAFDCRYEQSHSGTNHAAFPSDDVFRPLMADPKQPQFFATYQAPPAPTAHEYCERGRAVRQCRLCGIRREFRLLHQAARV